MRADPSLAQNDTKLEKISWSFVLSRHGIYAHRSSLPALGRPPKLSNFFEFLPLPG